VAKSICSGPPKRRENLGAIEEVLGNLDAIAPAVPLVAFGQTALWDEPFKALIAERTDRPVWVGIHDLDYFSRLRSPLAGPAWQIVPRNDGTHKETWIAAGEISALFGAEAGPSRQDLQEVGVPLSKLLPDAEPQRTAALDAMTESWGWRGIVQNTETPGVIADLTAREVAPSLRELITWGFDRTEQLIADRVGKESVRAERQSWLDAIDGFIAEQPEAPLCELYRRLFARAYVDILGQVPDNVEMTCTRHLLQFNRRTARRRRFAFARNFLGGRLAKLSRAAYDEAVSDSAINPLADAGEHATPFDVYVPGRGRGTLHIAHDHVRIDLPDAVTLGLSKRLRSVTALAALLEERFGPDICLVGKAMVLPTMLCAEGVMMLTETGSAYIPHTRQMLAILEREGAAPALHPILRLRLNPWNALRATRVRLKLPLHLAHAFEQETICASEFARRWRRVAKERRKILSKLGTMTSPSEFVTYLGHEEHSGWFKRLERNAEANDVLLDVQRRVDTLRHRAMNLRMKEDELQEQLRAGERRRGDFNRKTLRPLKRKLEALPPDAAQRKEREERYAAASEKGDALLMALEGLRTERSQLVSERKAIGRQIRAIERSPEAQAARRVQHEVAEEGMKARLALATHSLLTVQGLVHGDARPSAWWPSAVDPSGKWLARIRRGARCWIEPFLPASGR
jgi:hypothetical protein